MTNKISAGIDWGYESKPLMVVKKKKDAWKTISVVLLIAMTLYFGVCMVSWSIRSDQAILEGNVK